MLRDVIASGKIACARLTRIFHAKACKESLIVVNAHRINEGEVAASSRGGRRNEPSFYVVERRDPEVARKTAIVELVTRRIPRRFGLDPIRDVMQVLTLMHLASSCGTLVLNEALQAGLEPSTGCRSQCTVSASSVPATR